MHILQVNSGRQILQSSAAFHIFLYPLCCISGILVSASSGQLCGNANPLWLTHGLVKSIGTRNALHNPSTAAFLHSNGGQWGLGSPGHGPYVSLDLTPRLQSASSSACQASTLPTGLHDQPKIIILTFISAMLSQLCWLMSGLFSLWNPPY